MPSVDKNRFVNDVEDEFVCSICLNVFSFPDTVQDNNGHDFCSQCIKDCLKVQKCCPFDRSHLDETLLRPISYGFKALLAKLDVRCRFSKFGCKAIVKYETLADHEKGCSFIHEECKLCSILLSKEQIITHRCIAALWGIINGLKSDVNKMASEIVKLKDENKTLKDENKCLKDNNNDDIQPTRKSKRAKRDDSKSNTSQQNDAIESLTKNLFTKSFIVNKIDTIRCKILDYKCIGQKASAYNTFSINKAGLISIMSYNKVGKGEVQLFSSNFQFKKTIPLTIYKTHSAFLTSNALIVMHFYGKNNKSIKIEAFNTDECNFNPVHINSDTFKNTNNLIDLSYVECYDETKIYLKARFADGDTFKTLLYVFNDEIKEVKKYDLGVPEEILKIKIRNNHIFYTVASENQRDTHRFTFKMVGNNDVLHNFNIRIKELKDFCLAPNGNLFLLVSDTTRSVISEYDMNGQLIQSVRLVNIDDDIIPVSFMQITDNFHFLLGGISDRYLYLN